MLTAEPLPSTRPSASGNPVPPGYGFTLATWGRRTDCFVAVDTHSQSIAEKNSAAPRNSNHLRSPSIHGRNTFPLLVTSGSFSLTVLNGAEVLEYLHADGDVLQLEGYEDNTRPGLEGCAKRRQRVGFHSGYRLRQAKTVNGLLKAAYDVLEVHRTKLAQQIILQRESHAFDPSSVRCMDRRQVDKTPLLTIQRILSGQTRFAEDRLPTCLIIDYDGTRQVIEPQECMYRAGTPMYISRSECMDQVLTDVGNRILQRMPKLSGKAREIYVTARGEEGYSRYNDTKFTRHGTCPPPLEDFDVPPTFSHRPEHNVESIFWSLMSTLLRLRPKGAEDSPDGAYTFDVTWTVLLSHRIPSNPSIYTDPRHLVLRQSEEAWRVQFLGDMMDVGALLFNMSRQIRPEYALCGDGLLPDHLHEATQRLILQYVVDHDDILLDPGSPRLSASEKWVVEAVPPVPPLH